MYYYIVNSSVQEEPNYMYEESEVRIDNKSTYTTVV